MQMVPYKAPVATTMLFRPRMPVFSPSRGGTTISHTELIGDFTALTNDFESKKYEVNPGIAATFPWLSGLAINFETYKFKKLIFHYHTSAPTDESGTIYMAPDYDASDAGFPNEASISNTGGSVSIAVWKNTQMSVNTKLIHQQNPTLLVRSEYVGSAIADYDGCSVSVASLVKVPGSKGKLIVEYVVEFHTPNTSIDVAAPMIPNDQFYGSSTSGPATYSLNGFAYPNLSYDVNLNGIPNAFDYDAKNAQYLLKVPATVNLQGAVTPAVDTTGSGTAMFQAQLQSSVDGGATWSQQSGDCTELNATVAAFGSTVGWSFLKYFDADTLFRVVYAISGLAGGTILRAHYQKIRFELLASSRRLPLPT